MLRIYLFVLSLIFILPSCNNKLETVADSKQPVSHEIWDGLLKKHVNSDGFADYKGFKKDEKDLDSYLKLLSSAHPQTSWSKAEQMAYWINAYNAFTVKLILDYYPVKSIKDIKNGIPFVNSVWDIRFINIQGIEYDLNNIEHNILRKLYNDARIHAAINCASYSCPQLRNEAYVAEKLEKQLEEATRLFINDPRRNKVSRKEAEISKIFLWFGGDFKDENGSIRNFINKYSDTKLSADGKISYLNYDWSLNDVR